MKKLFLLLILSFFSAQSFAGSCPDGSEPVRSISEDGTYYVFNCSNNTNVSGQSGSSTIGQSIYKTITQGDPEIYEAQMLLNRFDYHIGQPNGQLTWETQSAIQKMYQDLGQNFDGKWSAKVLSDLKDRRLITMPRSGPLSFAEKDEMFSKVRLKYDDVSAMEKPWYQLNQLNFDVVSSDEPALPFCYPTPQDCSTDNPGLYLPDPHNAAVGDFNGDGLQDLAIAWIYFIHTTKREKTPSHVRFYLNDGKNNLISSPEIYALDEVPLRHMLYRMTVNDFNNDGRDDLFVGSMGVIMRVKNQSKSLVDYEPNLLLLSTQNGQMEDASHLIEGQENGGMIKGYRFSHATTSGDINCDGFADIYTGNILLIGDGTGKFSNKSRDLPKYHWGDSVNAFASTIADFNGDGCGDVVMSDYKKSTSVWMSHYGKHLPRSFKELKIENYYGKGNTYVNHMASGDLDGDGDPDLVAGISRLDPYYLGRKILIFINEEGELIEKTKTLIQDERDQDIEGRPQNGGEGSIRLVDHDRDGDLDIIDSTGGSWEKNGRFGFAIFENDGTGHFTAIPESEFVILRDEMLEGYSSNRSQTSIGYPIDIDGSGRLDYASFIHSPYSPAINAIYGYTVLGRDKPITQGELEKRKELLIKRDAELREELREELRKKDEELREELRKNPALSVVTDHSKKFDESMSKLDRVVFEGDDSFTPFDYPIPLDTSGALIVGFKELKKGPDGKDRPWIEARIHLKYGSHNISTNLQIQYVDTMMVGKLSFMLGDWGGTKEIYKFAAPGKFFVGSWEIGNNRGAMAELGIEAVLEDIQTKVRPILYNIDAQTYTSLSFLLYRDGTDSKTIIDHKKHISTDEEQSVEDEIAAFEAELEAETEDDEAKRKAKIAASKAKAAAAKAKRIAEEAAKSVETDTIDTEQSIEDEIAAFEAELAAELGE